MKGVTVASYKRSYLTRSNHTTLTRQDCESPFPSLFTNL